MDAKTLLAQADRLHDLFARENWQHSLTTHNSLALAGFCDAAAELARIQQDEPHREIAEKRAADYREDARRSLNQNGAGITPAWLWYFAGLAAKRPAPLGETEQEEVPTISQQAAHLVARTMIERDRPGVFKEREVTNIVEQSWKVIGLPHVEATLAALRTLGCPIPARETFPAPDGDY